MCFISVWQFQKYNVINLWIWHDSTYPSWKSNTSKIIDRLTMSINQTVYRLTFSFLLSCGIFLQLKVWAFCLIQKHVSIIGSHPLVHWILRFCLMKLSRSAMISVRIIKSLKGLLSLYRESGEIQSGPFYNDLRC
jgi:hypothetical protein